MSLLDAKPEDPGIERRRMLIGRVVVILVVLAILAAPLAWWFRYWPEERLVDKFLTAVEAKDYKTAFALWTADPQWEQHPGKYSTYTFGQFQLDWGPSGEWGEIKSHKVAGSVAPRSKITDVSGVVVAAQINGRAEPACLWVEKKSKTISFSYIPCTL